MNDPQKPPLCGRTVGRSDNWVVGGQLPDDVSRQAGSPVKGGVNLFNSGTVAKVGLSGNDLSIDFGPNGLTGLLTVSGTTGGPTSSCT